MTCVIESSKNRRASWLNSTVGNLTCSTRVSACGTPTMCAFVMLPGSGGPASTHGTGMRPVRRAKAAFGASSRRNAVGSTASSSRALRSSASPGRGKGRSQSTRTRSGSRERGSSRGSDREPRGTSRRVTTPRAYRAGAGGTAGGKRTEADASSRGSGLTASARSRARLTRNGSRHATTKSDRVRQARTTGSPRAWGSSMAGRKSGAPAGGSFSGRKRGKRTDDKELDDKLQVPKRCARLAYLPLLTSCACVSVYGVALSLWQAALQKLKVIKDHYKSMYARVGVPRTGGL